MMTDVLTGIEEALYKSCEKLLWRIAIDHDLEFEALRSRYLWDLPGGCAAGRGDLRTCRGVTVRGTRCGRSSKDRDGWCATHRPSKRRADCQQPRFVTADSREQVAAQGMLKFAAAGVEFSSDTSTSEFRP